MLFGEFMLLTLKIKILESRRRQYQIAHSLGWNPTKLSAIIHGAYEPSSSEKEDLAAELGVSMDEIFPRENKGVAIK